MKKICLNGLFKVTGISPKNERITFDAQVPGCVHTDLQNSGFFGDLFFGKNVQSCKWIEDWDFEFTRVFEIDNINGNEYLQFDGLDVFCDVFLNDALIGSADDMFVQYQFETAGHLNVGENTLKVHFYSTIHKVDDKPKTPVSFSSERLYVRRMQCTFGWDWVERLLTCGIWRDINLCIPDIIQIDSTYIRTTRIDSLGAQVVVDIEFSTINDSSFIVIEIISPDGEFIYTKKKRIVEKTTKFSIDICNPMLWWPAGYGDQPLYDLRVKVFNNDIENDSYKSKFGVRLVRIAQLEDKPGSLEYKKSIELKRTPHLLTNDNNEKFSGFILIINGTPIMCKGANWVPPEPFPSNIKVEKIRELLTLAKDGNLNMMRIWGGGIFESDYFYDKCDELGILVTQDFMMACARYPEDEEWFINNIKIETIQAAKRLRNHPSLVWWTGDNENGGGGNDDVADYPGRKTAMETMLPILEKYDPERMFLPTSPYGGTPYMSATSGTTHNTFYLDEMRVYIKNNGMEDYKAFFEGFLARFVPEEPTMGAPSEISLKKFMSDTEINGENSDGWRFHTRNHPAPEFVEFGLFDMMVVMAEKLFGRFKSAEDKLLKMQYVQYEWIRITMENFRRNKWYSSGLLYWMFNDCWPASGWAIVDYYCLPKAGYYGFKRSAKNLIVSIEKKDGFYNIYLCNDQPNKTKCDVEVFLQSTKDCEKLFCFSGTYEAGENISKKIIKIKESIINPLMTQNTILICNMKCNLGEDMAFYIPKRPGDINLFETKLEVLEQTDKQITIQSNKFVYAVRLDGEYIFEDNYFMLLPGKAKSVKMRPSHEAKSKIINVTMLNQSEN